MKKLIYLFTGLLLGLVTVNASTTETTKLNYINTSYNSGYGNSFIFNEQGIEFSVFRDGQFDFYMQNRGPQVSVSIGNHSSGISFNSGYNYNPYLQYDEFGAIIQIENVPVFYDYYGRVSQVGNVFINYNNRGYINNVGALYVHYNRYNRFSHCTGFINVYNRGYIFRPWHTYYRIPAFNHCVVYNRPYRQFYTPIRYIYNRPFINNYRRTTAIASRRGQTISRNRTLATRSEGMTRANHNTRPRTNTAITSTPRPSNNSTITRPIKSSTHQSTPRPSRPVATQSTTRPRTISTSRPSRNITSTTSTPRPSRSVTNNTKPRTSSIKSVPRSSRFNVSSSSRVSSSNSRSTSSRTRSSRSTRR